MCVVLNNRFGDRWTGRGDPIALPPRSTDILPLDFFFWGHINLSNSEKIPDVIQLSVESVEFVILEMLSCVWEEVDFCLDVCRTNNQVHKEL